MAGMLCPRCSADTEVKDSEPRKDNKVKRIRYCMNGECRIRFTTHEVILEDTIRDQEERKRVNISGHIMTN